MSEEQNNNPTQDQSDDISKPILDDVLSDEHIGVIARKVALKYSYANEYSYKMYVKAIIEGIKIGQKLKTQNK